MTITVPDVGQLVVVRKRPFVVSEIIPSAVPSGTPPQILHLLKLSSVEGDGIGEELQVIWQLEPGTAVYEKSTLPDPVSFDHPKRLQAFLDAVRWGAVSQADDRALQAPFRMRLMGLMPIYQKPNTSKPAKGHKTVPICRRRAVALSAVQRIRLRPAFRPAGYPVQRSQGAR
jgi:hypothetical protein